LMFQRLIVLAVERLSIVQSCPLLLTLPGARCMQYRLGFLRNNS
jgi:hypothetical protein